MAIQIFSNLNYPIGNIVKQEMQSSNNVQIAVAFLKYTGIKVIEKSMRQCLDKRGNLELIAGLDFKTTDYKSLEYFINLKKRRETTGIVGSANMTRGGLMTNFEVNTVFKEKKPLYFSQLQAIYNSVKFTDSIFIPDEEYLLGYSDIFKAFSKNEEKAKKDKGLQEVIKKIQKKEEILPGTIPSLKSLIIGVIKKKQKNENEFIQLQYIYQELEKIVKEKNLIYKMDTFRNTVRGEFNKHEDSSNHSDNMHLFIRSKDKKGFYSLTKKAKHYEGR